MPVKGLVVDLTHFHAQNVWGSRGERVRVAELAAYCNYLKKKKKTIMPMQLKQIN